MALQSVVSVNGIESKRFLIALIGTGPALDAFGDLMDHTDFAAAFPRVKIAGWVPSPGSLPDPASLSAPVLFKRSRLYPDIAALFAARPGIQLAIDLSPDSTYMDELRRCAPPATSICGADGLLRFCSAAEDGRLAVGGGANLRKAQRLFALLLDQMDGDILILDQHGIILDSNRHAAESRSMTTEEVIGKSCAALDPKSSFCKDEEDKCPFLIAKRTGKQASHTFSRLMPDGLLQYIHTVCFPVVDPLGSSSRYLYIRRDVTSSRHLEQRLQQAEKMAAIGELSTYMAHEIRNPLFSIGGFANALLRDPTLSEQAREKARIIYDESRRLDEILTNILNFARPTDQPMDVFDIEPVARQTMELMTIGSEKRGIDASIEIEPMLPLAVGNAENLKQCLINLVKNSLEAMPEGGALSLTAKRVQSLIRIDVADTGKGIPANLLDQVFSPFFSTKHGGPGLGLAMTRKVIEEMGGKVELESRVDEGTRIALFIPAALAVEEEAAANTVAGE